MVRRLAVGSVSEEIVHLANVPVLVVRGGERAWPLVRVIIGDDLSEDAHSAARLGVTLGMLMEAETLLVHAYEGMPLHPETLPQDEREFYEGIVEEYLREAKPALERRAAELIDAHGVRPQVLVVMGAPAQVLLEVAEEGGEPSFVVVGSRGLGATARVLLGSVSTKVLRATSVPVIVCPHES